MSRERGLVVTALFIVHRLLEGATGGKARLVPYALMAQPMASGHFGALREDRNTVIRRVDADEPLLRDCPRPAEVIAARFASGAHCYLAVVKSEFAGFIWICRDRYLEDEVRCRYVLVDESTVWDFDVYVAPRFRMGRTMARLWTAVAASLRDGGVKRSFSRISLFNEASINSHARLGAVRVGFAFFLVLGRMQISVSSVPRYLHLGFRRSAQIKLQ